VALALVLGLGGLATPALPRAAVADEVTLNVPVKLSNIATNVTRGRVQCIVQAFYHYGAPETRAVGSNGSSSEFAVGANGEYKGTVTVRVQIGPPQQWIDMGRKIEIGSAPQYFCQIQVATPSSGWYPELDSPMAMGQAPVRPNVPDWAVPRAGSKPLVNGTLTVSPK
jgi:hypothetical protein